MPDAFRLPRQIAPVAVRWAAAKPEDRDAAARIADRHNETLAVLGVDAVGQWFAAKLEDGSRGSGGALYPSNRDARRFHDTRRWLLIEIQPEPMPPVEAFVLLNYARGLVTNGARMPEPPRRLQTRILRNN